MKYFLTVTDNHDRFLHKNEQHDSLESALNVVSENYLKDPPQPWRANALCAIKDGQIYRITMSHGSTGHYTLCLLPTIRRIEIVSALQFLEAETYIHEPD
jgi:hypothetical protein